MIALVDYDNVPELIRSRGPVHVVERIVDALGPAVSSESEVRFRLYGGWFDAATLSRRAQHLAPVLSSDFPRTAFSVHRPPGSPLVVRAELALSLEFERGKYITHTYRDRALPNNVRCAALPFASCHNLAACPIAPVRALIRDCACPEPGCHVSLENVLSKPEQKLVDTMLTVDVTHLARSAREVLAVVSSDDDLWPGIQAALIYGARIVHVHPLVGRTTPLHYMPLATGLYSQSCF